jgi:hypothetical protein
MGGRSRQRAKAKIEDATQGVIDGTLTSRLGAARASARRSVDAGTAAGLDGRRRRVDVEGDLGDGERGALRARKAAREHQPGASAQPFEIIRVHRGLGVHQLVLVPRTTADAMPCQPKAGLAATDRHGACRCDGDGVGGPHDDGGAVPVTPCPQSARPGAPINYVDDSTRARRAVFPGVPWR